MRRVETGPQRVAPRDGSVLHAEHPDVRWLGEERYVGVPQVSLRRAVGGVLDPLERYVDATRAIGWIDVRRAETGRECDVLVVGEVLIAKEDHQVIEQRLVDLAEVAAAQ